MRVRSIAAYISFFSLGMIVCELSVIMLMLVPSAHWGIAANTTCTFSYYGKLLRELEDRRYSVLRVVDFIRMYKTGSLPLNKVVVILRHDVDFTPSLAYKMSEMEVSTPIRSTYYVRTRGPYNPLAKDFTGWLRRISEEGFEVGYHYETLYYTNYSFEEARKLFLQDIKILRWIVPVYTACSHGNKAKQKHINYEIFMRYPELFEEAEIEGEAYLTVKSIVNELKMEGKVNSFKYLSDTFRRDIDWIGELRRARPGDVIYILIHPDNWRP